MSPALRAHSLSHWTTREVLESCCLSFLICIIAVGWFCGVVVGFNGLIHVHVLQMLSA